MGYHSSVILIVEKPLVNSLLTALNQNKDAFGLLFSESDHETCENGDLLFRMEWVKWYSDFEDIRVIESWMDKVDTMQQISDEDTRGGEDCYRFHRLGEEYGDHEQRGHSIAWGVCLNHSLSIY